MNPHAERNKQLSILFRKYKPISMSLVIKKPPVQGMLPPLQIQASQKYQLKKKALRIDPVKIAITQSCEPASSEKIPNTGSFQCLSYSHRPSH